MEWAIGILAIILLGDIVDKWFKRREKLDEREDSLLKDKLNNFESRLQLIESRMANIETIVIDREKHDPYDALK